MRTFIFLTLFLGMTSRVLAADEVVYSGLSLDALRGANAWQGAGDVSPCPTNDRLFAIGSGKGIIVNGPLGKSADLLTKEEFGDVEVHVEFCITKHSNSGIYLMGRYEVQIYDSFGIEKDKYPGIECGGIYPRYDNKRHEYEGHSPRVNASKPSGEWQMFDIIFRAPRFDTSGKKIENARFVKVVHNGTVVHENVEVTGPTRGGYDGEKLAGPLRLQGDHGPVAYRIISIKPL